MAVPVCQETRPRVTSETVAVDWICVMNGKNDLGTRGEKEEERLIKRNMGGVQYRENKTDGSIRSWAEATTTTVAGDRQSSLIGANFSFRSGLERT